MTTDYPWPGHFPDGIFKGLPRIHAHSMLTRGDVQIGTLLYYRTIESDTRRDIGEGSQVSHSSPGTHEYNDRTDLPLFARNGLSLAGSRALRFDGENAMKIARGLRDQYVYCLTESIAEAERQAGQDGTVVEIVDLKAFLFELDAALRQHPAVRGRTVGPPAFDRCLYEGREFDWQSPVPPSWLSKPKDRVSEREARASWTAIPNDGIGRVVVTAPAIAALCCAVPKED